MMPVCEGLPTGQCPHSKPKNVKFTQGDMFLCDNCENARFGTKVKQLNDNTAEASAEVNVPSANDTKYICQPLLAYILFSLQSGSIENIKNAALGHFTHQEIVDAKNTLWDACGEMIGEKLNRKDSPTRSEREAHLSDIVTALTKLDTMEKSPTIVIDALSLHKIPRSHPEELNDISLVDRLNRFKSKLGKMQEIMDRYIAQNISLKEQVEAVSTRMSYASVTQHQNKMAPHLATASVPTHTDTHPKQIDVPQITLDRPDSQDTDSFRSNRGFGIGRARGRGHPQGRGGSNRVGGTYHLPNNPSMASNDHSMDRISVVSAPRSHASDGFQLPYLQNKHNKRKQKVITGKSHTTGGFKGAPEPTRELFIYRVDNETDVTDLQHHVHSHNFTIRDLKCISNPSAKFKSFRLAVPASEFQHLLSDNIWPDGVRVRRYIPPRNN